MEKNESTHFEELTYHLSQNHIIINYKKKILGLKHKKSPL